MSVGLKEPWDIPGHIGPLGPGRSLGTSKKSWTLLHGHPRVKWDQEGILGLVGHPRRLWGGEDYSLMYSCCFCRVFWQFPHFLPCWPQETRWGEMERVRGWEDG